MDLHEDDTGSAEPSTPAGRALDRLVSEAASLSPSPDAKALLRSGHLAGLEVQYGKQPVVACGQVTVDRRIECHGSVACACKELREQFELWTKWENHIGKGNNSNVPAKVMVQLQGGPVALKEILAKARQQQPVAPAPVASQSPVASRSAGDTSKSRDTPGSSKSKSDGNGDDSGGGGSGAPSSNSSSSDANGLDSGGHYTPLCYAAPPEVFSTDESEEEEGPSDEDEDADSGHLERHQPASQPMPAAPAAEIRQGRGGGGARRPEQPAQDVDLSVTGAESERSDPQEGAALPLGDDLDVQPGGQGGAYYHGMFQQAVESVREACIEAARHPDDNQARAALAALATAASDIKGTALELIIAAILLLKVKALEFGVRTVAQRRQVLVGKIASMPARGCTTDERPALWISRAPHGSTCHMCEEDRETVAKWFGGSEEQRDVLRTVLDHLMLHDNGFDILAVVEEASSQEGQEAQKHMVWVQVKYRSDGVFESSGIWEYIGKFDGLVKQPLDWLEERGRLHFMWASNKEKVACDMQQHRRVRFYSFWDFGMDWTRLNLLDNLPTVVPLLAGNWGQPDVRHPSPATAMQEQGGALEQLLQCWAGPLPRATVIAPTGSGKTVIASMAFTLSGAQGEHEARVVVDVMLKPHRLRTPEELGHIHVVYQQTLTRALLPLVFFAPSIELARQSLLRFLAEHERWQHSLRGEPALPQVRFVLVCSDTGPVATDAICQRASDVPKLLEKAHANPGTKFLIFTTIQGTRALRAHLRAFALKKAYPFGCNGGTPMSVLIGGRPLIGTVIHDEAHNQTGRQEKASTQPLLVSNQLSACSLSLTATPQEIVQRLAAKIAADDGADGLEDAAPQVSLEVAETVSDPLVNLKQAVGAVLEQAFPWSERMRRVSLDELASSVKMTRAQLSSKSDEELLSDKDSLLTAVACFTGCPAVMVGASAFGTAGGWAFPQERIPADDEGGGSSQVMYRWRWLGVRTPAGRFEPLARLTDRQVGGKLVDLGVLDQGLLTEDLIVIGRLGEAGAQDKPLALFEYHWQRFEVPPPAPVGFQQPPPPRGFVVHDQSAISWSWQEGDGDRLWNGNGHGKIAHVIGWNDALRVRDRMAGTDDRRSILPKEIAVQPLFANWLDSKLASLSEPLTPRSDARLPQEGSPQRLAYLLRRLLLRCSYRVRPREHVDDAEWDPEVDVDAALLTPERLAAAAGQPALAAALAADASFAAVKLVMERAVQAATADRDPASAGWIIWWRCDQDGQTEEEPYQRPVHLPASSLAAALPLGIPKIWSSTGGLDQLLLPVAAPRRRNAMVLPPTLVLIRQPVIPAGSFEQEGFAKNLFGWATVRLVSDESSRTAAVAQPNQIKLECTIGNKVFACTLQDLLTARMLVSAVVDAEPMQRNKMVVFTQYNKVARLLQQLFRAILVEAHPEHAAEIYDAHVFTSMTFNEAVDLERTSVAQGAEDNNRMLAKFRRARRAVLFNANYISEGFDCPSIDAVAICYPTKSKRKIIQMIGRCMRKDDWNPNKAPMVLLPVHDPQDATEQEFAKSDINDELVTLVAAESGVELPHTGYQRAYKSIRSYLGCMVDPTVRAITHAIKLASDSRNEDGDNGAHRPEMPGMRMRGAVGEDEHDEGGAAAGFGTIPLTPASTRKVLEAGECLCLARTMQRRGSAAPPDDSVQPGPAWDAWRANLAEFQQHNGRLPSRANGGEQDLTNWCQQQCGQKRALTEEQQASLQSLPGWSWSLKPAWRVRYSQLASFVAARGVLPRKKSDITLYHWADRQKERRLPVSYAGYTQLVNAEKAQPAPPAQPLQQQPQAPPPRGMPDNLVSGTLMTEDEMLALSRIPGWRWRKKQWLVQQAQADQAEEQQQPGNAEEPAATASESMQQGQDNVEPAPEEGVVPELDHLNFNDPDVARPANKVPAAEGLAPGSNAGLADHFRDLANKYRDSGRNKQKKDFNKAATVIDGWPAQITLDNFHRGSALHRELARQEGIGPGCLKIIEEYLERHL